MPKITLADEISKHILHDFSAGEALPCERELSERYSCNRQTLRRAIKQLGNSGKIISVARNGHFIAETIQDTPLIKEYGRTKKPHILVIMSRFSAPERPYIVNGMIHYASLLGAELTFKEIPDDLESGNIDSYKNILPDMDFDAYVISGYISFKFYELLAKSARPCLMIGLFKEQMINKDYTLRCLQVLLAIDQPYIEAADRLIAFGHRKILLASIFSNTETEHIKTVLSRRFAEAGLGNDCITDVSFRKQSHSPSVSSLEAAKSILSHLEDHTAVITISGGAFGCQVLHSIINDRKLKFPEDISIIAQGCEIDWHQELYGLDRIYFERSELGGACIREIMRQIENHKLEYGICYLAGSYISGKSLGAAKK